MLKFYSNRFFEERVKMISFVKNIYKYIRDIITGDEYLSTKSKYTYVLYFSSFIHLVNVFIFGAFENLPLLLYNLIAFLVYQLLATLVPRKVYFLITAVTVLEVTTGVILTSIAFGSVLGFNLYCFLLIPATFYVTGTVDTTKHSTLASLGVSLVVLATYIFSTFFVPENPSALYAGHEKVALFASIYNATLLVIFFTIFLLLFTLEMKNSTADLEKRNQQLAQAAAKDPLTRLSNRRSMMEHLNYSMHKFRVDKNPFSLILCDIDFFKKVNDTYGHDAGDKVLIHISDIISSQMRDTDFVCRWGGEEILIKVEGDLYTALNIADRIRIEVANSEVHFEDKSIRVTMTFGVAQAQENLQLEDFIQQADSRLYFGKENGRNRVVGDIPGVI